MSQPLRGPKAWLRQVDPSGNLDVFAARIERTFAHPGELVDRYVVRAKDGSHALLPQFFDDMCVLDPAHQRAFNNWFARETPPDTNPYSPELTKLMQMSLGEWLCHSDAGTGRLGRYRLPLQRNYDSVEQIFALHLLRQGGALKELSSKFFEDIGVRIAEDQALFQVPIHRALVADGIVGVPSEGQDVQQPDAYRDYSFAAWLREVDLGASSLLCYVNHFEENFDSVEQILQVYRSRGQHGWCDLHSSFFRDMCANDRDHQARFLEWFRRRCQPPVGDVDFRVALHVWLRDVAGSAPSLLRYLPHLESNYDTVAQIIKLYSIPEGIDAVFFADACIVDMGHQELFKQWFRKLNECDRSPSKRSGETAKTKADTGSSDLTASICVAGVSFDSWLREVGNLCQYTEMFTEIFDTPEQVVRLYVEGFPAAWSPQFFHDMPFLAAHKPLFESWLRETTPRLSERLLQSLSVSKGQCTEKQPSPLGPPSVFGPQDVSPDRVQPLAPGTTDAGKQFLSADMFYEAVD